MKKFILKLIFTTSFVLNYYTLSDYQRYLAAKVPPLSLLMTLNANDGAGFKNIAITEYLLKEKFNVLYNDLIDKNMQVKKTFTKLFNFRGAVFISFS